MKLRSTLFFAAAAAAAAAALPAGAAASKGLADPIPGSLPVAPFSVGVKTVATGLVSPTGGTFAPGVPSRLYVTDQIEKFGRSTCRRAAAAGVRSSPTSLPGW